MVIQNHEDPNGWQRKAYKDAFGGLFVFYYFLIQFVGTFIFIFIIREYKRHTTLNFRRLQIIERVYLFIWLFICFPLQI